MSRRAFHYLPILKKIVNMDDKVRKDYLRKCDDDLIRCFSECAQNLLKARVKLTSTQLKRLTPHKHHLRSLADRRTPLKKKRRIVQRGGFVQALLVPAIATLGSLLMKGIFNK